MNSPQERTTGYGATQAQSGAAGGPAAGGVPAAESAGADSGYPQQASARGYRDTGRHSAAAMTGIVLAGVLMVLDGLLEFFTGLAAVVKSSYYSALPNYAYRINVHSWGWIHLIVGLVVLAVGACLLMGMTWARFAGVAIVLISAVTSFLYLPYYPVWAIIVIAIDVFVLWALLRGPGRQRA